MQKFDKTELLIFDLDGTLLESSRVNYESIRRGLADIGWDIPVTQEQIDRLMVETSGNFYKKLLPADKLLQKEKLRAAVHKHYPSMVAEYGRAYPKMEEVLERLKKRGYKMALYSFAFPNYFDAAIKKLGFAQYFDYAESVQKSDVSKAELVLKIINNFDNPKTAVIGDSNYDIEAARANRAAAVGINYGYGGDSVKVADVVIDRVDELLEIFDRRRPIFEKIVAAIDGKKQKDKAFILGVNGIDASGKTQLAKGLQSFLENQGRKVQTINLDDFHNPKAVRYSGSDQADNYYTKSFDVSKLVNELLAPLRERGCLAVELDLLDLSTDDYTAKRTYNFDKDTIIILEGVFIFREELVPYLDYKVFVDIDFEESKRRAQERDVPVFGPSVMEKYDTKYLPAQARYLAECGPDKIADMVIDNSNWEYPITRKII